MKLKLVAASCAAFMATACKTPAPAGAASSLRADETVEGVCSTAATYKNEMINNFGAVNIAAAELYQKPASPEAARNLIASFFGPTCQAKIAQHLATAKPNVYVYFTGYGDARQNNARVDEGQLMQWINRRDPKAVILSISWDCAAAAAAGRPWCAQKAEQIALKNTDAPWVAMDRAFEVLAGGEGMKMSATLAQFATGYQAGYNSALAHSLEVATHVINHVLVADSGAPIGHINVIGYSMGAHAAADLLINDYRNGGFKWDAAGACETSGDTCKVAALKKLHWSLALGLSGWSHALTTHNQGRAEADRDQYGNGGFLRIRDAAYRKKLNVFNRRMDPTSNSDDTFQRAVGDVILGEYNHYSHDYSLPLFGQTSFVRELDAFLEAAEPRNVPEAGIVYDGAARVDFENCTGSVCAPSTNYLAHQVNRSHGNIAIMQTGTVTKGEGIAELTMAGKAGGSFGGASPPMVLYSLDQEDLRGAVEMYYKPNGDPSSGERVLFSYGACDASNQDLMPRATLSNGKLELAVRYGDKEYKASVDAAEAGLAAGKYSHLSFAWDMPTATFAVPHTSNADLQSKKARVQPHITKFGKSVILATGLQRPGPTTFREQRGVGKLTIHVNGKVKAEAALGNSASKRDCLMSAQVLNDVNYPVGNGTTYPPHLPYANYVKGQGDVVTLGPGMELGTKCKAFKIRNTQVYVGCSADGMMDNVALIFGPGRTAFDDVSDDGQPKRWSMGVDYGMEPFVAR